MPRVSWKSATWLACCFAWFLLGQARPLTAPFDEPPGWAREAIWYQIFVERFRNGDSANDPRPEYMRGAYPGYVPANWKAHRTFSWVGLGRRFSFPQKKRILVR